MVLKDGIHQVVAVNVQQNNQLNVTLERNGIQSIAANVASTLHTVIHHKNWMNQPALACAETNQLFVRKERNGMIRDAKRFAFYNHQLMDANLLDKNMTKMSANVVVQMKLEIHQHVIRDNSSVQNAAANASTHVHHQPHQQVVVKRE